MAIKKSESISKRRNEKFPGWLVQSISDNVDKKHSFFLREKSKETKWISWGQCIQNSQKNFIVYLKRKSPENIHKDPHWKYRAIRAIFLIEKVVINNQSERRLSYVIKKLNDFASNPPKFDSSDKLFLRTTHLETNKLNGFVSGFQNADRDIKAKSWPTAARRNTLRMMRTKFPDLTRSKSDWDICFKQCRANLSHYQESELIKAFAKNRNKFERLLSEELLSLCFQSGQTNFKDKENK
ncbi:hypothetical protein EHQ81_12065 [Leptospira selangorensis]|uniref:Uncharacterized protein n=1 Tax=Leptospira selangorensis TaxID=2484982 RepID=A0A5F2C229_9LEPT|nr:hypothetical protein [Leptospira selangorensis]TGM12983.1 hypothetical protein EHQ81_12065 [Leptospira selangorensis]TGM21265.1 hypothetical protein EHQ82_09680 [Leptospira selangorensis]